MVFTTDENCRCRKVGSLLLLTLLGRSNVISGFAVPRGELVATGRLKTRHEMASRSDDREPDPKRRQMMLSSAALASCLLHPNQPARADDDCGLDAILLGEGKWTKANKVEGTLPTRLRNVPPTFSAYAARYLLNFDKGAKSWWENTEKSFSLLPEEQRQARLGNVFGRLARSVQIAVERFLLDYESPAVAYARLAEKMLQKYGSDREASRQIGLLFAMLPESLQPADVLSKLSVKTMTKSKVDEATVESEVAVDLPTEVTNPPPRIMVDELNKLLPAEFECVRVKGTAGYTVYPPISFFEVGVDEEFGQTATATAVGPLAAMPLKRELPVFSFDIYTLFGISGAAGCALTHTVVIPLDVVKTKIQTDGSEASLIESAVTIVEKDGIEGLLLGAQATIAGYLWYGLSVYPCYAFFKRFLSQSVLTPELATIHANDVALVAGALAAVIASLGLTPIEASRIRAVADPETYRPKGMLGTLRVLATEDERLGWKALYTGLPSLMTRQVIFGSVKFLAFEKACEAIFGLWPFLHDAVWTSLGVSLAAGGISGALSSIISQPADSVLTYVAQSSRGNLGVVEGSIMMIQESGVASLFRGVGSRCVWAGTIIAGQFLLYDVFRNYFGVSTDDLSQVYEVVITSQATAT